VVIITPRVGEFHIWPLAHLVDARKEFKNDKMQIVPIPTLQDEAEWVTYIPEQVWEYFHEVLHMIPLEMIENGGRFKFSSGSEETLNSVCDMPTFFKNAH
jgi:hypothetical protein